MAFYHTVAPNTNRVLLKLFTVSFRKVYDDPNLSATAGEHLYTLSWSQVSSFANGLYYLVIEDQSGGTQTRKVMKLFIRR